MRVATKSSGGDDCADSETPIAISRTARTNVNCGMNDPEKKRGLSRSVAASAGHGLEHYAALQGPVSAEGRRWTATRQQGRSVQAHRPAGCSLVTNLAIEAVVRPDSIQTGQFTAEIPTVSQLFGTDTYGN